ncbi:MAG TPA: methionyl-tRNA formyltransferase [Syntrophales bacterium]|nr:methionyl-tRNA formyltransferase [Syntrophales bacterium]HOL58378.1 methionyl-tRNA formyltransferase [Syntrophales bacterium]HPO34547.1 methionyl-tRNA formyltransferase [Syntrophales bacterium]
MIEKPRLLFMGTPEFALPSLKALIDKGYPIVAVVTQPDKPQGRGKKLTPPPVKELALTHGLKVLQPEKVRDPAFLEAFKALNLDMVIVAAFGQILPPDLIHNPPYGCLNVHPSLLPRHRGPAPINWTLMRGDEVTGVTIMLMDEGVDTGPILLQRETPVEPDETFDRLHDRLARLGAELLIEAIELFVAGQITPRPQPLNGATYAPRLTKADALIDWSQGSEEIVRKIRGLSSTPGAFTYLKGQIFKVYKATSQKETHPLPPGTIGSPAPEGLPVAAGDGWVYLKEVQLEGKKRLPIQDFLRGYRISLGEQVG